jgi:hypothetical protein
MVSIGKPAAAQARYYLEQANGRVDVVESAGDGVEDYYLGDGEAHGEWIGAGARELSFAGGGDGSALRRVLAGLAPCDGGQLRSLAITGASYRADVGSRR